MSSTVGVSSLYPDLASSPFFSLKRVPPPRLLSFPGCRSHFKCFTLFQRGGGDRSIASSAVFTPNSVLSEEAFKGLSGFSHDALRVQEEEEEEEEGEEDHPSSDVGASGGDSTPDRDLAIANLGLPQPLVDSLHKRGITHLFPIHVVLPFLPVPLPSPPLPRFTLHYDDDDDDNNNNIKINNSSFRCCPFCFHFIISVFAIFFFLFLFLILPLFLLTSQIS